VSIRFVQSGHAGISVHAARAAPLTSLEDNAVCHFCIVVRSDEVISRRACCLPSRASMRVRRADIADLRGSNASADAKSLWNLSIVRVRPLRSGLRCLAAEGRGETKMEFWCRVLMPSRQSTHEDGPPPVPAPPAPTAPPAPPEFDPTSSSRPAILLPNDSIASIILS
jgi:hypothetical protein